MSHLVKRIRFASAEGSSQCIMLLTTRPSPCSLPPWLTWPAPVWARTTIPSKQLVRDYMDTRTRSDDPSPT